MENIGIFGGTFNPIHWGHLLVAETAFNQFGLDQVIWVPAYQPPHKRQPLPTFSQRLEMVQLAIADHPGFRVSSLEAEAPHMSYAITTLASLQALYPNTHWHWIVGMDAFQTLPKWRNSSTLAAQCIWLVAPRRTGGQQEGAQAAIDQQVLAPLGSLRWYPLSMPLIEISSSLIRQYCLESRSIRYLVPDPVRTYIEKLKLYTK
ncbi:nicotinate (nicotinamide) nucleotide adenylyltransferase [Leptothermofonsia sichuanensis E412]|uniref:nicotinate (nicotinamide) nucleotide adenylyltransferase n=1 Tax=Leptothermofonsia sichuanensis TaxID=2917832 RepID=UPI001CA76A3C|nr:nicotinate (nicotinamide) nucleotide adenylyltransferase [Leptothermofonsia sichuanensis]QZZ19566.1 nicotinate (nicotinamide) nucleotide adenylyltransferase [Leptothermofonsia sichuanensis E412]